MRWVCEDIKQNVARVVALWDRRSRDQPWCSLPPEHRVNSLPEVIVGLVEVALCRPADVEAHRQMVLAAALHGSHRRAQELELHWLFTEYHLLRQAVWEYLEETYGESEVASTAIMRIDSAVTVATNASILGYHRVEVEGTGAWADRLERVVHSSPFLRERDGYG